MKFLNNESSITFHSLSGTHEVAGGAIMRVQMLPDLIEYSGDYAIKTITPGVDEKHTFTLAKQRVISPVFIFAINENCALVGISRHGQRTNAIIAEKNGELEVVSENAIFQLRHSVGTNLPIVTTADRAKLAPFYNKLPKGSPQYSAPGYWAVATAIAEYGIPLDDNVDGVATTLRSAQSAIDRAYGVVDRAAPDKDYIVWQNVSKPIITDTGNSYILLDGRRIALPDGVRHTGKFEGLFVLEHKNGKVKEESILCLLDYKNPDPNTLALVENQIKMAEAFTASLKIFAEVLRADGQVVTPVPLDAKGKKSARKTPK